MLDCLPHTLRASADPGVAVPGETSEQAAEVIPAVLVLLPALTKDT